MVKNERIATIFSIHNLSSILIEFQQQGFKKKVKKSKDTKKWATLDLSVHVGSPNHEFSCKLFFFWSRPNWFPSKMMPCKLNHNFICLGHVPLSKGLETNLKLLTNKNARLHWNLVSSGPKTSVVSVTHTHKWSCCNSLSNTT